MKTFFERQALNRSRVGTFEVDLQHKLLSVVKGLFYRRVERIVFPLQKMNGTQDIDTAFVRLKLPQKALFLGAAFTNQGQDRSQKQQTKTEADASSIV